MIVFLGLFRFSKMCFSSCRVEKRGQIYFHFLENKSVPNGTYLTCFGCPFFLTSALADRRDLVSKG